MKFAVGDLVVEKKIIQPDSSYSIQKVATILDGALLVVHHGFGFDGQIHGEDYESEPGSRSWRSAFQRYQEEELLTVEEAEKERARLKAAKNKLNQEFDAVRDQVQAKLDAAAAAVLDAAKIVKAHDVEFYDLKQECMPLYQALVEGGWSHSHMKC